MTAGWRYLDRDGAACGSSREFRDREEAEAWLGERWPQLVESGIAAVELVEDGEPRYRMGLDEG